jgi:Bacterial inner membrane protein
VSSLTPDWIGWLATAVFLGSYFCKDQRRLRQVQAGAALLWVAYGAILHAVPIVVANLLVAAVAVYSSFAGARPLRSRSPALGDGVSSASAPDLSRIS